MRTNLLTSVFLLFCICWSNLASAQSAACVQSDQCFEFTYAGPTYNGNNTVTLNFSVKVNCNYDLSNAAFQLPAGATAFAYSPTGGIENPTNNPFYSIKWNTGSGTKNGASKSFSYTVSASAFATMSTIQVSAKAATTVGSVTFNANGCGSTPPPACSLTANISGPASVCPAAAQLYTYSTIAQAGAAYTWTVPAGFMILSGQNSNTISVSATSGATAGNIAVMVTKNGCTAANDVQAVTISTNCGTNPPACTLSAHISGSASVCPDVVGTYSTAVQTGAAYNWSVPAGWVIVSGQNSNTITAKPTSTGIAGNISVNVTKNGCTAANDMLAVSISNNCGSNPNGPCNTSQPRPITGNQHPCPGSIETYCIQNDRGYTSFEWDVPRAHAGNPPTGWVILSGQGTSCVTVRVGVKSGTMKVKVNDPICGTKVATLPVKPGKGFIVDVDGPDSVCANIQQVYTATVADSLGRGNGNGHGQVKGTFTYNWTVPTGWTIVSGQGTTTLTVMPGATDGQVRVTATYVANGNGNGNNGNGVGGYKGYCNTTASDAIDVVVNNNCGTPPTCSVNANISGPDTVCAYGDEPYTFSTPAQPNATYVWTVPADWFIDSGDGTNTIVVYAGAESGNVTVTVTNNCGTASDSEYVFATEDCGLINPLPVELINFAGKASSEGITLNWATATEKDNDRFEIQRSQDGRSFETVGTVKGNGSSSARHDYTFVDKAAKNGLNYYRLRQVEFNGKFEFSKIIKVAGKGNAEGSVTLYPNPTNDGVFNIRMTPTNEPASISIMDMSGKMISSQEVTNTSEVNINGHALGMKAGIYLISVKTGSTVVVEKLIVR